MQILEGAAAPGHRECAIAVSEQFGDIRPVDSRHKGPRPCALWFRRPRTISAKLASPIRSMKFLNRDDQYGESGTGELRLRRRLGVNDQRQTSAGMSVQGAQGLIHSPYRERPLDFHEQRIAADRLKVIRPDTEVEARLSIDNAYPPARLDRLEEDVGVETLYRDALAYPQPGQQLLSFVLSEWASSWAGRAFEMIAGRRRCLRVIQREVDGVEVIRASLGDELSLQVGRDGCPRCCDDQQWFPERESDARFQNGVQRRRSSEDDQNAIRQGDRASQAVHKVGAEVCDVREHVRLSTASFQSVEQGAQVEVARRRDV